MKKLTYVYSTIVLLLILFSACQDEVVKDRSAYSGPTLTAHFALSPISLTEYPIPSVESSLNTRSSAEEGLIAWEKGIGNVTIAQFAGTDGSAVLTGTPSYIGAYDNDTFDATLAISGGVEHTLLFIANTGDITNQITTGMTLAQAQALLHEVPVMISDINADGLPMVGKWQGAVTADKLLNNNQIVNIPMERIMAKVVLTVRSEVSELVVDKVQVNNVPTQVALYTTAEQNNYTTYTIPPFETNDPRRIWFMPENASNAVRNTQINIYASKDGKSYLYTTWLNTNGGDDYTVKRNTQYNLTVTIKRLTDAVENRELELDSYGEIYQLDASEFLIGKVANYSANTKTSGYSFALIESANSDATSYQPEYYCDWIQLKVAKTWGTAWSSSIGRNGGFSSSSGYKIHTYILDNLSTAPRFAKIRLRYDQYYIKPPGGSEEKKSMNYILTIKQNGSLFKGAFGAYNSVTGSYDKDMVTNYTDHPDLVTWADAQTICVTKFYDSANKNWYLPTQNQLAAMWITNYESKDALKGEYWSATEDAVNSANAWSIDYTTGMMTSTTKTATKKVRCVRDID